MSSEKAVFNLKRKMIGFPISVAGKEIKVFMRPYEATDAKNLLSALNFKVSTIEDGMNIKNSRGDELIEFFKKYFDHIEGLAKKDGLPVTFDEQLTWIRKNPRLGIERAVIMDGFAGASVVELKIPDSLGLMIDEESANNITLKQTLPNENGIMVNYEITHIMRQDTITDYKMFQQSRQCQKVTKKGEIEILIDYDVVENLYNDLIVSLEGATLDDVPCTIANKNDWIPLVPFMHKSFIITELYRAVELKNG